MFNGEHINLIKKQFSDDNLKRRSYITYVKYSMWSFYRISILFYIL